MNIHSKRSTLWLTSALLSTLALTSSAANAASDPAAFQAKHFEIDGKRLTTKPANAQAIAPLADALATFDESLGARKATAKDRAALANARSLVAQAKSEVRALAQRLKAAGEIDNFNAMVLARARETKSLALVNEIQQSGGGYALLLEADRRFDAELAEREKLTRVAALSLWSMLGISSAEAGILATVKSTLCGGFWFTISLGYAERHAYVSCYS